jgi:FSR family fosmidomycin resistance protein-like MFS transporter
MPVIKNRSLWALTLGHFSIDLYAGMLPLILLVLTDPLSLSYTEVGLVSTTYTVSASVTQPLFGYLTDRFGSRLVAVGSVIWIAGFMGTMGFADSFPTLLVLAPLAGLGAAAFHPLGAANAARVSGEQRGSGMSIFLIGGNTGFAVGPLLAGTLFAAVGARGTGFLPLLAIVLAPSLYLSLSRSSFPAASGDDSAAETSGTRMLEVAVVGILALMVVIFLRSWVHTSLITYLPQFYKAAGEPVGFTSNLLFAILLPLALGNLLGGWLSDRFGSRRVIFGSLLFIAPLGRLLLQTAGPLAFMWAILLGVTLGATFPVTLVMAQGMLPRGLGFMSGIALGFTFIAGGIGTALTGLLADRFGLDLTLHAIIWLPLIGVLCTLMLPEQRSTERARVVAETSTLRAD